MTGEEGEEARTVLAPCNSPWCKFPEEFALGAVGFVVGGSGSCLSGCPKVLNLALHFPAASL